jgi:transcriptional regulator with GAF, ATPase, and Fis domain
LVTVVPCLTTMQANGVIEGPQGAAACLGLRRTTLRYRMEKLGISRQPQ